MQTTICGLPLLAPLSTARGRDYYGALPVLTKDEVPATGYRIAVGFPPAYSIYVGRWFDDPKGLETGVRWSWQSTRFVEPPCARCGLAA